MLVDRIDSKVYIQEFKSRFSNFCEKAPAVLSFTASDSKVQVIDETTDTIYEFDWDFTTPVKHFIHGIKMVLTEHCYPIIVKCEEKNEPIPVEEQAKMAEEGMNLDIIPTMRKVVTKTPFLIDKVIVYKDIFLIKNIYTDELFRYQLTKSSINFLKKIRSGQWSPEKAADFFFKNSVFLNKVIAKNEQDSKTLEE